MLVNLASVLLLQSVTDQ